jgi:hypothetical protein
MGKVMQCLAPSAVSAPVRNQLVPAAYTLFVAAEQQPALLAVLRAAALHGATAGQLDSAPLVKRDHWRAALTLAF